MDHKLELGDEIKGNDKLGPADAGTAAAATKDYEVVSEAGLFKNGRQYSKGENISLVAKAAENFLASGDIKEIE